MGAAKPQASDSAVNQMAVLEQKHPIDRPADGWTRLAPLSTCPTAAQIGRHVVIELYDCDATTLNDVDAVEAHLIEAAKRCRTTIVGHVFHKFGEIGVSGVVVVAESHLSIHTWPEHGYAAVDFFTCGARPEPQRGLDYLKEAFRAGSGCLLEIARGLKNAPPTSETPIESCCSGGAMCS